MLRSECHWAAASLGAMVLAVLLLTGATRCFADGKLTEENMTKRDFERLTKTESSVEGESRVEPPEPIHNPTDEELKNIANAGGVKVISGKTWTKETPEERDAHLRRMLATAPLGTRFIVSVPDGEVWIIPGTGEDSDDPPPDFHFMILIIGNVRIWTTPEQAALPVAVPREKKVSQSDKRGTGSDSFAAAPKEQEEED